MKQPCDLVAFLIRDNPKWERIGEAHLSFYASAYNRVETNQPPQDLFISLMRYLVQLLFISFYNIGLPVPNDSLYNIFPVRVWLWNATLR